MGDTVDLSDYRPPVQYTVEITHYWDGSISWRVRDVQLDPMSCAAVAKSLRDFAALLDWAFYGRVANDDGPDDAPPDAAA